MEPMQVIVTGSSGYIGSFVVEALRRAGHTTVGVDRREPEWVAPDHFIRRDLMDPGLRGALPGDVGCVVHLAAAKDDWGLSDADYYRDNLHATEALLDACSHIPRWVFFSTVSVLGPSEKALDESAPPAPTIAYGASKAEAEQLFADFSSQNPDAQVTVVRPSAVFGPRNPPTTNVYRLIDAIARGRFVMVGDGAALKSTSYLGNLLAATEYLMNRMTPGLGTYVYVDTPVLSTRDLVDRISDMLDKPRPRRRIPLWIAKPVARASDVTGNLFKIDFPITAARIAKFSTPTNYAPTALTQLGFAAPVAHDEALRATVDWYLEQH
jgi:nucleoside-diphosphate-sugar epimerase